MADENLEFTPIAEGPQRVPALGAGELHLWCARFDLSVPPASWMGEVLSRAERDRSDRFRFVRDRHRSTYTHGWLRRLLSGYGDRPAADIHFEEGPQGKPEVIGRWICFNLSHSGECVIFAFARTGPLGVDIEECRPIKEWEAIAQAHFAPGERRAFGRMAPQDREAAFFHCWTRKEAYLKAVGSGLSFPLEAVEVTCQPEESARLVSLDGDLRAAAAWSLYSLAPWERYVGCLAVPRRLWNIRAWKWTAASGIGSVRLAL